MIALLLAALLFSPPHWPDRAHLDSVAGRDSLVALAVAWQESGANLNPRLRGHHCWYSYLQYNIPAHQDTNVVVTHKSVVHHEADCEVGRFQIKPSTARRRCPGLNVWTYDGNVRCFVHMLEEDAAAGGMLYAIRHHNGSGPRAADYLQRVLATIGWITEEP